MKIANKKASSFVTRCLPFVGNNTMGKKLSPNVYVAYSYGEHFPIFAKLFGIWFRNSSKYSVTTSKHTSQLFPDVPGFRSADTLTLKELIAAAMAKDREESQAPV